MTGMTATGVNNAIGNVVVISTAIVFIQELGGSLYMAECCLGVSLQQNC